MRRATGGTSVGPRLPRRQENPRHARRREPSAIRLRSKPDKDAVLSGQTARVGLPILASDRNGGRMNAAVSNSMTSAPVVESRARPVALHRDVLLATDGSPAAFAATRFVSALIARTPVTTRVLTVVPPPPTIIDPVGVGAVFGRTLEEQLGNEVQRQLELCS